MRYDLGAGFAATVSGHIARAEYWRKLDSHAYTVDDDLVVLAPERGHDPHVGHATSGLQTKPDSWLITDPETSQTNRAGVFAAGDSTGTLQLAAVAIAEARKVAACLHEYLS